MPNLEINFTVYGRLSADDLECLEQIIFPIPNYADENQYEARILGRWPTEEDTNNYDQAKALLLSELTNEQRKCYKKHNYFMVNGKDGKVYRITDESSFNVSCGEYIYCLTTTKETPIPDRMLIQKYLLENNPEAFFNKANRKPKDLLRLFCGIGV